MIRRWAALLFLTTTAACTSTFTPAMKRDLESKLAATHQPIADCYRAALKKDDQLAGKVMVRFAVAGASVTPTSVTADYGRALKNEALEKCIVEKTREIRLADAPEVPVVVTYPLELKPLGP